MAVSSLLLWLDPDANDPDRTLESLAAQPHLTLGTPVQLRVPAVLDTPTIQQDIDTVAQLLALPGIAHVDVLGVFFDDTQTVSPGGSDV
ncbi:MAG TPA: hypothetical protein PLJ27_02800 [Polyangiaceae bacterium]|nr:MAG: hypothetical protein BWY17_03487 [Deltaproteobacteria bacterium ADurb.Bin207]HNS98306.1 hypothetical protein [Polyangiaceae bacterium]HNZ24846.1 hypothetical protein [Polyangiaceae bacterium]HOD22054.1 hypothetical protein [Polyangiaceae bacterium]HOE50682.1 hypothetical protein [Polyangiaceae bacterium]